MAIRDSLLRLLYFISTIRDGTNHKLKKMICGSCGVTGHMRTSKKCKNRKDLDKIVRRGDRKNLTTISARAASYVGVIDVDEEEER